MNTAKKSVAKNSLDLSGQMANVTRREALRTISILGASAVLVGCGAGSATGSASYGPQTEVIPEVDDPVATPDAADTEPATTQAAPEPEKTPAQELLDTMTLEQKVAQLFFVTPERLTGAEVATISGEMTKEALANIPVGGLIYFSQNIQGNQQFRDMVSGNVALSQGSGAGVPIFSGIDEEGGTLVARVARSGYFDVETFPNMVNVGATGDSSQAAYVGTTIGSYLKDIGLTVDFAPDADVLTNPDNTAIGARSFGSDPDLVASMVGAEVEAMVATGTCPCAKHFPGHGDTAGDSHTGEAISYRSMDDLVSCEYKPFSAAIDASVPFIMVGHIKTPNAAADDLPATLSTKMITDELRGRLGFNGVVISDSMGMGAITQYYDQATAGVMFLQAGGDMLLMPADLGAMYQGVLDAVSAGTLSEERINESVLRILNAKVTAGLIS